MTAQPCSAKQLNSAFKAYEMKLVEMDKQLAILMRDLKTVYEI